MNDNLVSLSRLRDLSEIGRGGGGVENGGGSQFFEPSKKEGYEKK